MELIAQALPVVVTGGLGVVGFLVSLYTAKYQVRAGVEAEDRRRQFEAASELLALAYDVRDLVNAAIINREMPVKRPYPDVSGHVSRARRLAAQCMTISDTEVAEAAFELSDAIESEIRDLDDWMEADPGRVLLSAEFVHSLTKFEMACRQVRSFDGFRRRASELDLPKPGAPRSARSPRAVIEADPEA